MLKRLRMEKIAAVRRTPTHLYFAPHPYLRPYIAHYTISFPNPDAAEVYLFVEFLPGGHRRLTGLHQPDLVDRQIPLALLAPALEAQVRDLMESAPNVDALVGGLDAVFLTRMAQSEDLPSSLAGLNVLPSSTVREIADGSCYSQRQMDRIFREGVGMPPKTYLRILRINRAVKLLRPGVRLTRIAQEAGYFDQSHFIRDFKTVCGVTPGTYLQNMSVFYNEPLKF